MTINLSNIASTGVAQEWQLAAINPSDQTRAGITQLADIHFSGTSFTVTVPQESVEIFVLKRATAGLTHDEQFVQGLYQDFLGRTGAVAELDAWVAALPSLGRAGVASAIARSTEALSGLVNGLYTHFLNRSADPAGLAAWVRALQQGMTEEQVIAGLLASPEFAGRANALIGGANADANFVVVLYSLLLGRSATAGEVQAWLPWVSSIGRQGVASDFLASGEFRGDAVRTFYGDPSQKPSPWEPFFINLLHRGQPPSGGEIAAWVNSPFDLLTIETIMAGSLEYYDLH